MRIENPVLKGFYPDPSICRVKDDFYMIHSTFNYFPGIPIFKSTDLKNWYQIGHVLTRQEQLPLEGLRQNQGIYASTLYHHQDLYYIVSTNIGHGGNFIIWSKEITGQWSNPHYLKDIDGIDPSLFFDQDGKCYYVGARGSTNPRHFGDGEIFVVEFDLETFETIGKENVIWKGAFARSTWQEGPHLYRKDDWYYIMISEGGTEFYHSLTIARSRFIFGEYESNPANPILTHRHLGRDYPVANVGHGDLVEFEDQQWSLICLGVRKEADFSMIGREPFLATVTWENGWPVVNAGLGRLDSTIDLNILDNSKEKVIELENPLRLSLQAFSSLYLRNPIKNHYQEQGHTLCLKPTPYFVEEDRSPTFIGLRQRSYSWEFQTKIDFSRCLESARAGILLLIDDDHYLRFFYSKNDQNTDSGIYLESNDAGRKNKRFLFPLETDKIEISLSYQAEEVEVYVKIPNQATRQKVGYQQVAFLNLEKLHCFTGSVIGIFAQNECYEDSKNSWIQYSDTFYQDKDK